MEIHNKLLAIIVRIYKSAEELRNISFELQRVLLPYFKDKREQKKDDISRAAFLTRFILEVRHHINELEKLLKQMEELLK